MRFKPACSATETSSKIEILLVASLDMILSNKRQTKALIRLVCTFVVHKPPKTAFLISLGTEHYFKICGQIFISLGTSVKQIKMMCCLCDQDLYGQGHRTRSNGKLFLEHNFNILCLISYHLAHASTITRQCVVFMTLGSRL